jgi:hypothetical protein
MNPKALFLFALLNTVPLFCSRQPIVIPPSAAPLEQIFTRDDVAKHEMPTIFTKVMSRTENNFMRQIAFVPEATDNTIKIITEDNPTQTWPQKLQIKPEGFDEAYLEFIVKTIVAGKPANSYLSCPLNSATGPFALAWIQFRPSSKKDPDKVSDNVAEKVLDGSRLENTENKEQFVEIAFNLHHPSPRDLELFLNHPAFAEIEKLKRINNIFTRLFKRRFHHPELQSVFENFINCYFEQSSLHKEIFPDTFSFDPKTGHFTATCQGSGNKTEPRKITIAQSLDALITFLEAKNLNPSIKLSAKNGVKKISEAAFRKIIDVLAWIVIKTTRFCFSIFSEVMAKAAKDFAKDPKTQMLAKTCENASNITPNTMDEGVVKSKQVIVEVANIVINTIEGIAAENEMKVQVMNALQQQRQLALQNGDGQRTTPLALEGGHGLRHALPTGPIIQDMSELPKVNAVVPPLQNAQQVTTSTSNTNSPVPTSPAPQNSNPQVVTPSAEDQNKGPVINDISETPPESSTPVTGTAENVDNYDDLLDSTFDEFNGTCNPCPIPIATQQAPVPSFPAGTYVIDPNNLRPGDLEVLNMLQQQMNNLNPELAQELGTFWNNLTQGTPVSLPMNSRPCTNKSTSETVFGPRDQSTTTNSPLPVDDFPKFIASETNPQPGTQKLAQLENEQYRLFNNLLTTIEAFQHQAAQNQESSETYNVQELTASNGEKVKVEELDSDNKVFDKTVTVKKVDTVVED